MIALIPLILENDSVWWFWFGEFFCDFNGL